MSAAPSEPVEIEDFESVEDAADIWADEYGTEEAIQRLWKAVGYLKRRKAREDSDE